MQEQPQASGPVGGLADKALGGLTKFMTNVNRGVERVLSNPLYERAWSGMVSGMYGDPMAGPLAVQQLRQNAMSQEIQRREMKAMEESPTQRAIRESEENARLYRMRLDERLRYTPMSDPQYREAWAARYPLAYGKQAFAAPGAAPKLQLDYETRPDGMRRRVQVNPDGTTTPLVGAQWTPPQPPMQINMPNQEYARGGDLRGEWTKNVVAPTKVGVDAIKRITEGAKRQSPAGDIALIFGFMKMQDPTSTVREGEYATAQNAAGIPERIRQAYNKALTGEGLTPEMRADYVNTATAQFDSNYRQPYLQQEKFYKGVVERAGLRPEDVMLDAIGEFRDGLPGSGQQVLTPPSDAPEGSKPIPGLPGVWEAPNGDWYRN